MALAATGDSPRRRRKRAELAKVRRHAAGGNALTGSTPAPTFLAIALAVLDGRIATAKGDRKAAIGHFEAAVSLQDKIAYNEPADWYYPVRETLGATLLLDGQAARGRGGVPRRSEEDAAQRPLAVRPVAEPCSRRAKPRMPSWCAAATRRSGMNSELQLKIEAL